MARQRRNPPANAALAEIIDRTGQTMAAIADHINHVAAENGIRLSCSSTHIGNWLDGRVPRESTRPAVVEALARVSGRTDLTATQLGWPEAAPRLGPRPAWDSDPITRLAQLARNDMLDPNAAMAEPYAVEALPLPQEPTPPWWSFADDTMHAAAPCDITHIWGMTRSLFLTATRHGGGRGRSALSAYLLNEIVPHLRATTGPTRPKLLHATSHLARVLGWMSADAGAEGQAQQYLVQALRLADEAGDPITRAHVLFHLFTQASHLGHVTLMGPLTDAAADAVRRGCNPRTRAAVTGQRALVLAAGGDRKGALNALHIAERDFERTDSRNESPWYEEFPHVCFMYMAGCALMRLGDMAGAESHLANALTQYHPNDAHMQALTTTVHARVQIAQGRLADASNALHRLTLEADTIVSPRLRREMTTLRNMLNAGKTSAMAQARDLSTTRLLV